jgi:ABC-type transport system involved in multi-copper enzyme maturation permease subunit
MHALPALIHVSFQNIVRQSFFYLAIVGAYIFIVSTPAFTMFTFWDAEKLLLDMSMATILLVGLLVSVLATSSIVGGEIEEKTTTLLLSKPLSRFTFLLAKFCAVVLALIFVLIPLTCVLIMTLQVGVPEAIWSDVNYHTLWFEFLPLIGAALVAAVLNYYADKNFASSFIILLNVFIVLSLVILSFISKDPLRINLFYPTILLWMAAILICPISSLLALKGRVFFTLTFSFLIFALGLISNWLLGNLLHNPGIRIVYSIIPNFQVFWIEEFWTKKESIPISYFVNVLKYVVLYCAGMIFLTWSILENREVSGGR